MSPCEEYRVKTLRYLDNDLRGQELHDFRAHVERCASCGANLEAEQALSHILHRSRPLYSAPAELRDRVSEAAVQYPASIRKGKGLHQRLLEILERGLANSTRYASRLSVSVPAVVIIVLFLIVFPNVVRQARAANYVKTAVTAHRGCLDGSLALGLRSSSPELVTAWFTDKVPFHFRLPSAQFAPDAVPSYRLTGASLVTYRGRPAALVTYEKQREKISLLVASSESAEVAGGDEVRFGSLTFHYRTQNNFQVITWSNRGLSYALVSSESGSAREACRVCHQEVADRQNIKPGSFEPAR